MNKLLTICIAMLLLASSAHAHSAQSGDIGIGHIWAYPVQIPAEQGGFFMQGVPAGNTIDVFGPVFNGGQADDAIMRVSSPNAPTARLVRWIRGQQMVENFPVPLLHGKPLALGPQTFFIRLYGVNGAFKAGDKFPITFYFRNSPEATIDVIVQARE